MKIKNDKGVVILGALALSLVLSIALSSVLQLTTTETTLTNQLTSQKASLYLSEAGISLAEKYLRDLAASPPGGTSTLYPFGTSTISPPNGQYGGYSISITPDADNPSKDMKGYTIQSSGIIGSEMRILSSVVRMESFAKFAYFSNAEYNSRYGFNIWFTTNDVIEGPMHSNDQFNISNDPVFMGEVTSTAASFNYMHGGPPGDNPDFQSGYQLGVDTKTLPVNLSIFQNQVSSGGLTIPNDTIITLNSDGTMTYTDGLGGGASSTTIDLSTINGTVYVEGLAGVRGTLNGQLTIATEEDMYIIDNIVYNDDPIINPSSTDALGLVSESDIYVWQYAPYNVEIDAVMMALNSSFEVQSWHSGIEGTLTVYGGIIQEFRGPVGTFYSSTGAKASGYSKNYIYDSRMRTNPPPGYPLTGSFERISWEEI